MSSNPESWEVSLLPLTIRQHIPIACHPPCLLFTSDLLNAALTVFEGKWITKIQQQGHKQLGFLPSVAYCVNRLLNQQTLSKAEADNGTNGDSDTAQGNKAARSEQWWEVVDQC